MKKLLIAVIMIMVFVSGCGKNQNSNQETNTIENETIDNSEVTEETEKPEIPQDIATTLDSANRFSEGVAWVKYYNPNNNYESNVGILDTEGNIITNDQLIEINELGSDFSGGYSYINFDDGRFVIVDKNGNITAESPEDGTYEIITGGDGVYFVYHPVKGMEVNEDRYGFIDFNGKWLVEPCVNHPLYLKQREKYEMNYYYNGDHIFSSRNDYFDTIGIYDSNTGETLTFEPENMFGNTYLSYDDEENDEPFITSDGTLFFYEYPEFGDYILYTYKDGKLTEIAQSEHHPYYNDGIYWAGDLNNGAFYDLTGNKLLDFSKYKILDYQVDGFYEFYNGIAPVLIDGADEEYYLSYIDMKGEFLFEPIQISHASNDQGHGKGSGTAVLVVIPDEKTFGKYAIIASDGTVSELEEGIDFSEQTASSKIYDVEFCDGYAWCEASKCFVGTNGKRLDTFVKSNGDE